MTQRFIFGIDVTPRKEYREEIERQDVRVCELEQSLDQAKNELAAFSKECARWRKMYNELKESTPARDKNGKFAKRKK